MKIVIAIVLIIGCASAFGAEYSIDLKLKNLSLRKYEYTPSVSESERVQLKYGNEIRSYFVHLPKYSSKEMPVLIALHGAGRSGSSMVDAWKNCSEKHKLLVVAPNGIGNNWDVAIDDSSFIRAATKDALKRAGIAPKEIYLFGHSNGARKAIALAAMYPNEYSAVVAHAGTLPSVRLSRNSLPNERKPKIGLFIGDKDHIFSIESARATSSWLEKSGYIPTIFVLQNHSHWYYEDFDRINESVWAFLSKI